METKNIDCVEMQRAIRNEFWEESNENIYNLEKIIDKELEKSELYKIYKSRLVSNVSDFDLNLVV